MTDVMADHKSTHTSQYANLDFLRSLAVFSVVAQHLWHQCVNFGICGYDPSTNQFLANLSFTGVMFFFVHTCLVLMLSMHRAPAFHRARSFFIRRAFRIYPLCWATILLALTTGLTDVPNAEIHALGWSGIVANVLLVQNLVRSVPSIVGPLWSLPWEVQMYLVLPLLFAAQIRFKGLVPVFALWLGSALLAVGFTQPGLPRYFHGAIFPPMFIGGVVAYKLLTQRRRKPDAYLIPAWSWPIFVVALFFLKNFLVGKHSFESPYGAVINAGICLLLGIAIPAFEEVRSRWVVRPAQEIAKYSYGIYLLHVPALFVAFRYMHSLPVALKILIFFVLTGLLSFLSFHMIEDPLIRLGKRLTTYQLPSFSYGSEAASTRLCESNVSQPIAIAAEIAMPKRSEYGTGLHFPKISVLMSVYHKESPIYLRHSLHSIAMQTVRADEVVIVEDGPIGEQLTSSIDEFRDILPIRSLRLERNVGLGAALQCGLDSCHGEYIVRMDSDDICAPERFEKQLSFLNLHPEVDVLGGAIAEFDQDPAFPHSARVPPVCGASLLEFARHRNPLNHVTAMFRKASVLAVGGYQPFAGFEDYHLWARMLSKGFCLWNLQETLVYVRCGNGMQARRGGFQYAKRDVAFQLYLYNLGLVSGGELLRNVFIRVPFRLVPGKIRQSCYRVWLRERVVPDPS